MNKYFLLLLGSFSWFVSQVQAVEVESTVSAVTLYQNKARETRTGKILLRQTGEQELVFTNISRNIEPQSLQVSVSGATVLSVTTRMNYLDKNTQTVQLQKWRDSLELLEEQRGWLREKLAVAQGELKILDVNMEVGGEQTLSYVKATEDMANQYKVRALKIRETMFALQKEDKELEKTVKNLQAQIASQGNNRQPVQEIVVLIAAAKSGEVAYKCQYLVNNAGWTPVYDIKAGSLNEPIQLLMKASIRQLTGYDWKNIQLTLSTANPSANQSRPVLSPEYVTYVRNPQPELQEVVINMAYSKSKPANSREFFDADGVADTFDAEETPTAQVYQIDRPQNLVSKNEAQLVNITAAELKAEYIYHTVPKKEATAFLVGKIPGWEQYNLLRGTANIFFEDTYVGQTTIDPKVVSDTLLLSLGRDELINIDRQSVKDVTSKKTIGSAKREEKAFEITVKNNKKVSADIEILDQIPVSNQKDIEVSLNADGGAEYTPENGRLRWTISLKPGESRKLRFSYTIKYPANQEIYIR